MVLWSNTHQNTSLYPVSHSRSEILSGKSRKDSRFALRPKSRPISLLLRSKRRLSIAPNRFMPYALSPVGVRSQEPRPFYPNQVAPQKNDCDNRNRRNIASRENNCDCEVKWRCEAVEHGDLHHHHGARQVANKEYDRDPDHAPNR